MKVTCGHSSNDEKVTMNDEGKRKVYEVKTSSYIVIHQSKVNIKLKPILNFSVMIISNLQHSQRIESLHPLFKRLFDYVKQHDLLHQETGKIVLEGEQLFINNVSIEGKCPTEQALELHRDYIDVHILLEGEESIGWKPLENLEKELKPYEKEGDCALYSDKPTTFVKMNPGEFVVVFPEDPHAPAIGEGNIRKLIAKVSV